jgi:hypothetical protein
MPASDQRRSLWSSRTSSLKPLSIGWSYFELSGFNRDDVYGQIRVITQHRPGERMISASRPKSRLMK